VELILPTDNPKGAIFHVSTKGKSIKMLSNTLWHLIKVKSITELGDPVLESSVRLAVRSGRFDENPLKCLVNH
jgi:hypothetical protein